MRFCDPSPRHMFARCKGPTKALDGFLTHGPLYEAYYERHSMPWLTMASDSRRAIAAYTVPPLALGLRQSRLPIMLLFPTIVGIRSDWSPRNQLPRPSAF